MSDQDRKNSENWEGLFWDSHKYNDRKKLKTGTYLHSYCPFCSHELTEGNVLKLEVITPDGEKGFVELSPYLNVYEHRTNIQLPEGEVVRDMLCPACGKSLKVDGKKYGHGDANVARFLVGISNSRVPFLICMKVGCKWHAIDAEDENEILLDDSDEW